MNIAEAKAHLSELVDAALAGEEIVIARRNKPEVKLTVVRPARRPRPRFGTLKGTILYADFESPLPGWEPYLASDEQVAAANRLVEKKR